ncbi:DedA family protein [Mariniluteicoccus flavus]
MTEHPDKAPDTEQPVTTETERPLTKEELQEQRIAEGRAAMRQVIPWEGKATRTDRALVICMGVAFALSLAMIPIKPFLLGRNPVLLEFITGNTSAIGAGAAFARIGQAPLWLVIVAGVIGSIKFDWLFWWMGRRWGGRIVRLFIPNPKMQERVDRAEHLPKWVGAVAVLIGVLPGVPTAAAYAFAGWQKLRLPAFLALNILSTTLWVGLIAGLGYAAGQRAVDIVMMVDKYALWVSLALIFGMAFWGARRQKAR